VLKDLQRHPAKPFILHVDFQRVSMEEKLRMTVPLHFENEATAVGVKKGGVVSHNLTEIEITCLPKDLPEFIVVDMAQMEIGDIIHVSELALPEGVELTHAHRVETPVVMIQAGYGGSASEDDEEGEARRSRVEAPASSDARAFATGPRTQRRRGPGLSRRALPRAFFCSGGRRDVMTTRHPAHRRARQSRGRLRGDAAQRRLLVRGSAGGTPSRAISCRGQVPWGAGAHQVADRTCGC
jgi:hypothetical protein